MNTTYTQKPETAQRVANNNAANLMDTSLQNASLQRKADMANGAVQRMSMPDVQAPDIRVIDDHAHKHGYTDEEIRQFHNAGSNNAKQNGDFYNIPFLNSQNEQEFIGVRSNGTVAHAGPFGVNLTAQL